MGPNKGPGLPPQPPDPWPCLHQTHQGRGMLLRRQKAPHGIIHGPAVVGITHGDVHLKLLAVPQAKQGDGGLVPKARGSGPKKWGPRNMVDFSTKKEGNATAETAKAWFQAPKLRGFTTTNDPNKLSHEKFHKPCCLSWELPFPWCFRQHPCAIFAACILAVAGPYPFPLRTSCT